MKRFAFSGKHLLVLAFFYLPGSAHGQQIVIQDPELELQFTKPKTWKVYDDTLNIYLLPPQPMSDPFSYNYDYLKITYYEAPSASFLDPFTEFSTESTSPIEPTNARKSGMEKIDGKTASWVIYDSLDAEVPKRIILFRYSKHGQDFQITGVARKKNFSKLRRKFRKVVSSFRTRRVL